MRLPCLALFLLMECLAFRAEANCEPAVMVGGLHDAYFAMVNESGGTRRLAATTVLVLVGDRPSSSHAAQLRRAGVEFETHRLDQILADARELATRALANPELNIDRTAHASNINWLGALYEGTRCRYSLVHASPPVPSGNRADGQLQNLPPVTTRAKESDFDAIRVAMIVLASVAGLAGSLFAADAVKKSLIFRRRRAERQPRTAISLAFDLTFVDGDGTPRRQRVRAHDVSAGGMKLGWEGSPSVGTELTLALPIGDVAATVIWSNAFYAGVMFDEFLDEARLAKMAQNH